MSRKFERLTRPNIRGLKSGARITEHGITAECLKNGDVRYSVNVMVDGQRIHRTIGRDSDGVTRSQAEQYIEARRSEARESRLSLPVGRKTMPTFAHAARIYLGRQRETNAKNIKAKEQHIRLHLVPYLGSIRLDRISSFTLEKFRRHLESKGQSTGTRNRIATTYNHMARRLIEWRIINTPLPLLVSETEHNRREYVLTQEEETRLLDAAIRDVHPYSWLFVTFGLNSGMRHAEILSSRFEHFSFERRRIRVRVKGGRWRDQPLTQSLAEAIARERDMAQDYNGWIFPSGMTTSGHIESMSKPFRRCVITSALSTRNVTPHTMRHTAITRLAGTGADIATVQAFSGHQSIEMVMRYTHAQDQKVDAALDKMQAERTLGERHFSIQP